MWINKTKFHEDGLFLTHTGGPLDGEVEWMQVSEAQLIRCITCKECGGIHVISASVIGTVVMEVSNAPEAR